MQTPSSSPTKATIHALRSGSAVGGLLSLGTWSTQTLVTFTISGTGSSFTVTSSNGSCGTSSGTFACGSGVSQIAFSAVRYELGLSFHSEVHDGMVDYSTRSHLEETFS